MEKSATNALWDPCLSLLMPGLGFEVQGLTCVEMTASDLTLTQTDDSQGLSDTQLRYLGYVGRIGRLVKSVSRYLAYTSDIGEAFRPIVSPNVVKAAYAISWLYVGTDVSVTGYQESKVPGTTGNDIAQVCLKRGVFQTLAVSHNLFNFVKLINPEYGPPKYYNSSSEFLHINNLLY